MPLGQIPDLIPILPELFLALVVMALLMFGVFQKGGDKEIDVKAFRIISWLSIISLIVALLLVMALPNRHLIAFNGLFLSDTYSVFCKILVMSGSAVTLIIGQQFLERHDMARFEYPVILVLATLGMLMMISANDLISLYLGLELQSLSLYVIAAFRRDDTRSSEAGLKYFVLGAIASGLLLYGMSMIYGITGSLDIGQIAAFATSANLNSDQVLILNFGLVFLVIGVAFKFGAVPFHMWVPDVYQGAPTSVTMFLSTVPKIAATAMLLRLLIDGLGALQAYWADLFMILAILSIGLGSLVALMQTNIKRLLAYSTISHIGFVMLGFVTGVVEGYGAAVFYVLAYVLMSLTAFGIIIVFNKQGFEADQIVDFRGLSKHSPWFALIMLFVMLSMAGVPPFIGFYSKLFILQQVISAGYVYLAVAAVVFAVISAYYYLQIIKSMYFDDAEKEVTVSAPIDMRIILSINGVLILVLGLMPSYWMELAISLF